MPIIPLDSQSLPENCFVFKHSTRCPVSFSAADEVKAAQNVKLPIYWINVVEQRPISNWIASEYEVAHQSPQLILIHNGVVKQSWSHGSVVRELLESDH